MPNEKKLSKFFAKKKVFITGHTGFKGSWLAFLLNEMGAEVMGFALPPQTTENHFDLLKLDKKINHIVGDILDAPKLFKSIKDFEPEFVFHLAAQALVRRSYEEPQATYLTNIIGSVNILEAVRNCESVRSLVYITSDKCYENMEWSWGYRENDQLGGRDPYSASKASAEIIFSSYARSFFNQNLNLGAATVRAGNVIGGGDWSEDRIVPDCIRAIQNNKPIYIRNPHAIRPWQHVLEPLSGYILLAESLYHNPKKYGGAWNFGPSSNDVRTVKNLADSLVKHIGKGRIEIFEQEKNVHEAILLQLNCDKANQVLGWYPRWNFEKTLEATALWYKIILNGGDAELISRSQIEEFFMGSL